MHFYGGIYLDVDVECVTPFDRCACVWACGWWVCVRACGFEVDEARRGLWGPVGVTRTQPKTKSDCGGCTAGTSGATAPGYWGWVRDETRGSHGEAMGEGREGEAVTVMLQEPSAGHVARCDRGLGLGLGSPWSGRGGGWQRP